MVHVKFDDNSREVLGGMHAAVVRILSMWGIKIERYAKKLCPVGTSESTGVKGYQGGTLRNSITFEVDADAEVPNVSAGTNVDWGPYVELGTGPYFEPPPEWERFEVPPASGLGHSYVHARPFLRPAILDHVDELKQIAENGLKK